MVNHYTLLNVFGNLNMNSQSKPDFEAALKNVNSRFTNGFNNLQENLLNPASRNSFVMIMSSFNNEYLTSTSAF
jgi:predicted YcjX-like family ATPase